MASAKPKSKYMSSNMDQGALQELQGVLANYQAQRTAAGPGEGVSFNQISGYLSNRSMVGQLTQLFSFASTINNHTDVIACSNSFSELINLASPIPELHQYVKPLIEDLISSSNIKVFYRCLNIHRPNITNPVLRLMVAIVSFNSGSHVDAFLEIFDLTLKSLPHLLIPLAAEKINTELARSGKQSVRRWMVAFWIALASNASSITRNDLLTNNRKIMSHLFKYMPTYDSEETIKQILEFCDAKILMEPAYRKATKGKILNEWALSKFAEVFQRNQVNAELKAFLVKATTDDDHGLSFQDTRTYFVAPPTIAQDNGALITVGEKTFKVSNKLVYILLTHLTPWTDVIQLDLTIQILSHIPELIAPYTAHIFFNHGTHEPRLTAFYIGQSLMLTRILCVPVPLTFRKSLKEFLRELDPTANNTKLVSRVLSSDHLANCICPPMFTRGVLVKGLNSPDGIIRITTAQLIVAVTKKYHALMDTLSMDGNSVLSNIRLELREIFMQRIPESSSIVGIVNEVLVPADGKAVDKLLLITILKLVQNYQNALEISVPVTLGNFGKLIGVDLGEGGVEQSEHKDVSNIDMLLLNTYLDLISTSFNDTASKNKWWNVTKGSKNTLFTIVAKLPWTLQENGVISNDLVSKVVNVLQSFTQDKLVFQSEVLSSQCWAIVSALLRLFKYTKGNTFAMEAICKIIDESISRCVKTPYKYIDMNTEIASDKRLSPYYFAVCEQSKFAADDQKATVVEFLNVLSAYLHIIGEPVEIMNIAFKKYWDTDLSFSGTTFEFYLNENSAIWAVDKEESSFFDLISFSSFDTLRSLASSPSTVCKSTYDSVALIGRINSLIHANNEKKYQLDKIESVVVDLTSLWGNYAMHAYNQLTIGTSESVIDARYWKMILFQDGDSDAVIGKKYFVLGLLNEVFTKIWKFDTSTETEKSARFSTIREAVIDLLRSLNENTDKRIISKVCELLWVLNDKDVISFLELFTGEFSAKIANRLLKISLERNISVSEELFLNLAKSVDSDILTSAVSNVTFTSKNVHALFDLAGTSETFYDVLNKICSTSASNAELVSELVKANSDDIVNSTSGFNLVLTLSALESSFIPLVVKKAATYIENAIEDKAINNSILTYIKAFIVEENGGQKKVRAIIETLSTLDEFKNNASLIFSEEVTMLISEQATDLPQNFIRSWVHRATLYITKMFAESEALPIQFIHFLSSLNRMFFNGTFWSHISKEMIDSQLETILSKNWIQDELVLQYATWVVMTAPKNMINCNRHITFLMNNPHNPMTVVTSSESLRFGGCLLLWYLIKANKKVANTDLMLKVIKLYRGTLSASDCLLKRILAELEENLRTSWAEYVTTWDFVEELDLKTSAIIPDLVMDTPGITNGLTINLNKIILNNTLKHFNPYANVNVVDFQGKNKAEEWKQWATFQETHILYDCFSNGELVYDVEFMLLMLCNNDELFELKMEDDSTTSVVVNLRALIDSGLLQLCVTALAHESSTVQQIATKLLAAAYKWNNTELEMIEKYREQKSRPNNTAMPQTISDDTEVRLSQFKERTMFKVVLGNLLYTLQDKEAEERTSRLVLVMWGQLIPILANPAHYLYEKAYRYLLLSSKFRPNEIPLYRAITEQQKDQYGTEENDDSDYYKEMEWLLTAITDAITGKEDLKVLKRSNIFEYVMNLSQSPFVRATVMELIKKFIERVITLENGADLLIRSYGLLSGVENQSILNEMNVRMRGDVNKWSEVGVMALVGSQLNGNDKRSLEWTDGDFNRVVKRVCK